MSRRDQRTVLTTGANSGIGLATALRVAELGFRSVGSVRSEAKADIVAKAAADRGVEVETVLLEVTDADRCAEVIDRYRPWGLVNNAGFGTAGAIEDVDDDEARQILETMVVAPARLARLALPHQRRAGTGAVVNVSSIAGRATLPLAGWYTASKHALEALTDALRVEVASAGIRVVLVEPGGFRTNIWEETRGNVDTRAGSRYEGAYRRSLAGIRLLEPIMGQPDQVARVIGHALTAPIVLPRYLVGIDAAALALAQRWVPTAVRDLATRIGLGL